MAKLRELFVRYEALWSGIFLVAGSLFIFISRWLTRSQYFYHWDGVQFGLALEHFDLSQHQPHPPGYILYIALGRIVNFFVNDPHTTLILLSILFSIGTFIVLFYFARSIFGKTNAYLSALFLIFVPIFLFHGSVALVYAVEAFWVILLAYLAWLAIKNKSLSSFLWFSLVLGLAGGFRQTLLVFLAPLWLYLAWRMRWRSLWGILVLGISVLAWFIPLLVLVGGGENYLEAMRSVLVSFASLSDERSVLAGGLPAIWHNLLVTLSTLWQSFNLGLLVFLMVAFVPFFTEIRKTINYRPDYRKWWLFGLFILPSLIFYLFILLGNPGYLLFVIVLMVPLFVEGLITLVGLFTPGLSNSIFWQRAGVIGGFIALVIIYNLFLWTRPSELAWRPLLFSFKQIKQADHSLEAELEGVKEFFKPEESLILIDGEFVHSGFRHYMYYLPDYRVYSPAPAGLRQSKGKVWLGYQHQSVLLDKMLIEKNIKKVAYIRSSWHILTDEEGILLPEGLFLVYFNLENELGRSHIKRFKPVEFANESAVEEESSVTD